MNVNFDYKAPAKNEKIYFDTIFAEKTGGGLVSNPSFDIEISTAVGLSDGKYVPIKAYKLYAAAGSSDTSIKIEKGSGIVSGDILASGKVAVASTAVDQTNAEYDVVTISFGSALAKGKVMYQAKAASANSAAPKYTPLYLTGAVVEAGKGDQLVKLVNGANVRKETAHVAEEVAALIPTITLI